MEPYSAAARRRSGSFEYNRELLKEKKGVGQASTNSKISWTVSCGAKSLRPWGVGLHL